MLTSMYDSFSIDQISFRIPVKLYHGSGWMNSVMVVFLQNSDYTADDGLHFLTTGILPANWFESAV